MRKVHHLFYLHRMVKCRNNYTLLLATRSHYCDRLKEQAEVGKTHKLFLIHCMHNTNHFMTTCDLPIAAYRNSQLLGLGSELIFLSAIFSFYLALWKLMISFTQKFYCANLKKKECFFRLSKPFWLKQCTNKRFLLLKMFKILTFSKAILSQQLWKFVKKSILD